MQNPCVADEYHSDFASLLSFIEKTKMNAEMLILLQQQEKAMKRKSVQGYRWHPK